jgi:hypothetical protein
VLDALLCLLPALALVAVLLARRYPGERTLLALRGEVARRPRRKRARVQTGSARRAEVLLARGGLLIGRALAVRPPPRSLPAS